MGLKIATFTQVNNYGLSIPVFMTWGGMTIRWRTDQEKYIVFHTYASADEYTRNPNSKIDAFHLPLTQEQLESILAVEGNVGLAISDSSWALAEATAFIPDWSEINEDGQRVMTLKSLTDLGATIVDLG